MDIRTAAEEAEGGEAPSTTTEYFELSFDKKHKDLILSSYIPHVDTKGKEIRGS
ncbi:hypothetical protein F2Q69_00044641 [Brassica cretica]|uniref:Uncharacterized protein n=1 Tax=Brassica cretica TaxID=69181 RepID=A0A8S9NLF1_BRACR|nr:hypothetical protein F2Q69_00044641 [Brassica cretica]